MSKICYILRGLPGTGKSHLAENLKEGNRLVDMNGYADIFSTDDLFVVDGEYQFDPSKLGEHHATTLDNASRFMDKYSQFDGKVICIVDNTNTQHWEYEKYVEAAKSYGFIVQVISIDWDAKDIPLYAERNTHGVPIEAIYRMAARWE